MYFDTSANKMKVYNGTTNAWDDVASVGSFYVNTISSSSATGGGSATFNGSAYRFTLSNAGTSAQQHIVSVNGVIQKPNSGTSQPSEGFALSGNDIIFSAAPASGSDSFIITCGSSVSIGTPSANSVNSSHIIDGSIVDGDISNSANIAGSKLADDSIPEVKLDVHNAPATDKYLKYTSNGMEWSDGASEGTDVKSTGESGTAKFLRVDGDGTCSWQVPPSYTHPNHSGEVTSTADGAQVIASNVVDEDNLKVSNSPTNGQVLSAQSGNTGGLTWTTISAAPEIEATATGAISDQAAIAVRSDGTIEAISGDNEATGSITDFDSTTSTYIMPVRVLYDPDINKVVIFYVRMQSGDPYFYSMICGINSNNTLSLGTQKKISTPDSMDRIGGGQSNTNATACYNTTNNKYMIAYRGQDNRMHTAHGTVQSNHTDITWTSGGNHTDSEMYQPNHISMEYSPDDNSAQLVWRRSSDNYLYRANFQYSSSQDKLHMQNSPSAVISQSSSNIKISYDTNVNRYMIGYKNDQGSAVGRIVTTDDSGGDSQGPYAFSNGDTGGNMAIFVPSENKSIICYSTSSATGLFAKVVTQASDGSITYGAEVGVDTTGSASHITTDLDATNNKVVVSWYNGGTGVRYVSSGTISGTTTTWSSRYTVTNGVGHAAIGWNTNDGKSLIASRHGNNNDEGQAQAYRPASTNLTTENFIGFAKAAINSGAAGAVKVTGNTATKSSLTPGQKYYVQNDGSIGLTPAIGTEVEAGIALSSTKLLIKG